MLVSTANPVSAQGEIVVRRGDNITITVHLLQNGTFGDPVPYQTIEFYDQTHNTSLANDTTNASGIASINWTIPLSFPLGSTLINATFRGNESLFLSPSTQWVLLSIISSTQIIVEYEIGSFAPGDSFYLTASLFDDSNTPISGSRLIVMSENVQLASSITNSSGIALFSIQCNSSWANLGENIIRVIHQEDLVNFYAETEESFIIDVQKVAISLKIENHPDEVLLGDNLTIDIHLSGDDGGFSAEIRVYVDDGFFDTLMTDALGNATFYLDVDTRFMSGLHIFQLIYNGTERYTSSFINFELKIMSPALVDIDIPANPLIGNITPIKIAVSDYFGRPFEGTLIILSDNTSGFNTTLQVLHSPPNSEIQFPFSAPPGMHYLKLVLENPFITNGTHYFSLLVWSRPLLILLESNIIHYASLAQELLFTIRLTDWSGNCSHRPLQILLNDLVIFAETTDNDGIAFLKIIAPNLEGLYNISIVYTGNNTLFETSAQYDYKLTVSRLIPVHLELYQFEVLPPLQEVTIQLRAQCLNGSLLAGIPISFIWLSYEVIVQSEQGGALILHLPVPSEGGNYSLHYEIMSGHGISYSSGSIKILILSIDALASQGIGIGGFAISIMASLATITIPMIKHRYLTK
ncbi:MAG: hypothetical protein ACFFEF_00120 [Candidatus Thorarchaeota archaeon]